MQIETVSNPAYKTEIKFENLPSGTVFELEGGAKLLKLQGNRHIILTYSSGDDWFDVGDGSLIKNHKITKVWGKLVGLKVQL